MIPLDSSRVGLVMGDVAGKGLAAASMVGRLRSAMRAYATEGHEPAQVVSRLNELVVSEVGDSEMATLVYLVLDPAAEEVRWSTPVTRRRSCWATSSRGSWRADARCRWA